MRPQTPHRNRVAPTSKHLDDQHGRASGHWTSIGSAPSTPLAPSGHSKLNKGERPGGHVSVIVCNSHVDVARAVADVVEQCLTTVARPVLGLATGATVEATYAELVRRHDGGLSFANATAFLLDEYIGLGTASKQGYRQSIRERLSDRVDFGPKAIHGPNGDAPDPHDEARRYETAVLDAGVDVQLLGIGRNGHIGFNEPGSSLGGGTHVARLAATTRADNARFFPDSAATPVSAITQGIATIMAAGRIVLVALGESKANAVARALEGPITCSVPASALQLHADATFVLDTAAAGELTFSLST